jgi:hypothetical protein
MRRSAAYSRRYQGTEAIERRGGVRRKDRPDPKSFVSFLSGLSRGDSGDSSCPERYPRADQASTQRAPCRELSTAAAMKRISRKPSELRRGTRAIDNSDVRRSRCAVRKARGTVLDQFASRQLAQADVEDRRQQQSEQGYAEHAREHCDARGRTHLGAGAAREHERNRAGDERDRGHHDGPESQAAGLERGLDDAFALELDELTAIMRLLTETSISTSGRALKKHRHDWPDEMVGGPP